MPGIPTPIYAVGVRLGVPDGSDKACFLDCRAELAAAHGESVTADLGLAIDGDAEAARRFATSLVPGASYEIRRDGDNLSVEYGLSARGLAGRTSSRRMPVSQLIAAAAIHLHEQAAA